RFPKATVPDSVRKLPRAREPMPEPRKTTAASEAQRPEPGTVASRPEGAEHPLLPRVASAAAARDARAECAPLDAERYKIAFTASASLKEKLEAARALVSHSLPAATLADTVERALDVLLERERARRFAVRQQRGPKERQAPQGE